MIKKYDPECFCDRCGKQISEGKGWHGIKIFPDYRNTASHHIKYDICTDCFNKFENFMKEKEESL